jgi:hypothetical protein
VTPAMARALIRAGRAFLDTLEVEVARLPGAELQIGAGDNEALQPKRRQQRQPYKPPEGPIDPVSVARAENALRRAGLVVNDSGRKI